MQPPLTQTIAQLKTLIKPRPQALDGTRPVIVLFHGYGASSDDLYPLAYETPHAEQFDWVFPQGPLRLPHYDGHAWFEIDVDGLMHSEAARAQFIETRPPGLDQTALRLHDFFKELGLPQSKLILGGFSQGAMIATDLSLQLENNPLGVLILSGYLMDRENWHKLSAKRKGTAFCQIHGTHDDILSYEVAKQLTPLLMDNGWQGSFISFHGGHSISPATLKAMGTFIQERLAHFA